MGGKCFRGSHQRSASLISKTFALAGTSAERELQRCCQVISRNWTTSAEQKAWHPLPRQPTVLYTLDVHKHSRIDHLGPGDASARHIYDLLSQGVYASPMNETIYQASNFGLRNPVVGDHCIAFVKSLGGFYYGVVDEVIGGGVKVLFQPWGFTVKYGSSLPTIDTHNLAIVHGTTPFKGTAPKATSAQRAASEELERHQGHASGHASSGHASGHASHHAHHQGGNNAASHTGVNKEMQEILLKAIGICDNEGILQILKRITSEIARDANVASDLVDLREKLAAAGQGAASPALHQALTEVQSHMEAFISVVRIRDIFKTNGAPSSDLMVIKGISKESTERCRAAIDKVLHMLIIPTLKQGDRIDMVQNIVGAKLLMSPGGIRYLEDAQNSFLFEGTKTLELFKCGSPDDKKVLANMYREQTVESMKSHIFGDQLMNFVGSSCQDELKALAKKTKVVVCQIYIAIAMGERLRLTASKVELVNTAVAELVRDPDSLQEILMCLREIDPESITRLTGIVGDITKEIVDDDKRHYDFLAEENAFILSVTKINPSLASGLRKVRTLQELDLALATLDQEIISKHDPLMRPVFAQVPVYRSKKSEWICRKMFNAETPTGSAKLEDILEKYIDTAKVSDADGMCLKTLKGMPFGQCAMIYGTKMCDNAPLKSKALEQSEDLNNRIKSSDCKVLLGDDLAMLYLATDCEHSEVRNLAASVLKDVAMHPYFLLETQSKCSINGINGVSKLLFQRNVRNTILVKFIELYVKEHYAKPFTSAVTGLAARLHKTIKDKINGVSSAEDNVGSSTKPPDSLRRILLTAITNSTSLTETDSREEIRHLCLNAERMYTVALISNTAVWSTLPGFRKFIKGGMFTKGSFSNNLARSAWVEILGAPDDSCPETSSST